MVEELLLLGLLEQVLVELAVVVGHDGSKGRLRRARAAHQTRRNHLRSRRTSLGRIRKRVPQLLPEESVSPVEHDIGLEVEAEVGIDVTA